MFASTTPNNPVLTPCIGICELDASGYCEGCHRTGNEIAAWGQLNDADRLRIMNEVLPARELANSLAVRVRE